jgi:hypothetical protein
MHPAQRHKKAKRDVMGNGLKLFLLWGFVGIPLAWGIAQTVNNALKLFQ